DPNVMKTFKSFSAGVDWLLEGSYSDQDITEAKLGVFSQVGELIFVLIIIT
ncbi:hypothetical protein AVEN_107493-1, partial [Araneus ventricosus]